MTTKAEAAEEKAAAQSDALLAAKVEAAEAAMDEVTEEDIKAVACAMAHATVGIDEWQSHVDQARLALATHRAIEAVGKARAARKSKK
jgi:hypothetical protein